MAQLNMVLLCSLLAIAIALAPAQGQDSKMTWQPCEGPARRTSVKNVVLLPDPPVIGSPATFSVTAEIAGAEIPHGAVDITVSYGGVDIYSMEEDLCTKTSCPIMPGSFTMTIIEDLPPIAPPGTYGMKIQAHGADPDELLCIDVTFTLVFPSLFNQCGRSSSLHCMKSVARNLAARWNPNRRALAAEAWHNRKVVLN
eukprot:gene16883-23158_t